MDSLLVTLLSETGIAGAVVVALMIAGVLVPKPTHDRAIEDSARKDAEIAKLQEALALERQRSNDTTRAGEVTIRLVEGLVKLAGEHGEHHEDHGGGADDRALPAAGRPALDLGAGDLGL